MWPGIVLRWFGDCGTHLKRERAMSLDGEENSPQRHGDFAVRLRREPRWNAQPNGHRDLRGFKPSCCLSLCALCALWLNRK